MEKQPTYKKLEKENERPRVEIRRKEERIIWLERMLFGSKRDKAPKPSSPNEPTLFDDFFEKACEERDKDIEKTKGLLHHSLSNHGRGARQGNAQRLGKALCSLQIPLSL